MTQIFNNQRKALENEVAKIKNKFSIFEMDTNASISTWKMKISKMADYNTIKFYIKDQIEESELDTHRIISKRLDGNWYYNHL